ncbi:MAG: hypothetical protein IPK85_05660 [Gemmatimonadetes bacterium]|nr:hypothetical protein [Gemmatimonadota bacterium]
MPTSRKAIALLLLSGLSQVAAAQGTIQGKVEAVLRRFSLAQLPRDSVALLGALRALGAQAPMATVELASSLQIRLMSVEHEMLKLQARDCKRSWVASSGERSARLCLEDRPKYPNFRFSTQVSRDMLAVTELSQLATAAFEAASWMAGPREYALLRRLNPGPGQEELIGNTGVRLALASAGVPPAPDAATLALIDHLKRLTAEASDEVYRHLVSMEQSVACRALREYADRASEPLRDRLYPTGLFKFPPC